jgi:hypothetical protein
VKSCTVDGCAAKALAKGLCKAHYERKRRYGDPLLFAPKKPYPRRPVRERWEKYVDRSAPGHHLWIGAKDEHGYGVLGVGTVGVDQRLARAHRLAWEYAHGEIPSGLLVLHHCDTPACVQTDPDETYPDGHLFLGTQRDNVRDMMAKGRMRLPGARS